MAWAHVGVGEPLNSERILFRGSAIGAHLCLTRQSLVCEELSPGFVKLSKPFSMPRMLPPALVGIIQSQDIKLFCSQFQKQWS